MYCKAKYVKSSLVFPMTYVGIVQLGLTFRRISQHCNTTGPWGTGRAPFFGPIPITGTRRGFPSAEHEQLGGDQFLLMPGAPVFALEADLHVLQGCTLAVGLWDESWSMARLPLDKRRRRGGDRRGLPWPGGLRQEERPEAVDEAARGSLGHPSRNMGFWGHGFLGQ